MWLETAASLELDLNEIPDHVPLSQLAVLDISVSEEGGLVAPGRVPLTVAAVRSVLASCGAIRELRISDWAVSAV